MKNSYWGVLKDKKLPSNTLQGNFDKLLKTDLFVVSYEGQGPPSKIVVDLSPSNRKLVPIPELAQAFYDYLLQSLEPNIQSSIYLYWERFRRIRIGRNTEEIKALVQQQVREISIRILPTNVAFFNESFETTEHLTYQKEEIEELLDRKRSGFVDEVSRQDWILDFLWGQDLRKPNEALENTLIEVIDLESAVRVLDKLQSQLERPKQKDQVTSETPKSNDPPQIDTKLLLELIKNHF